MDKYVFKHVALPLLGLIILFIIWPGLTLAAILFMGLVKLNS